MFQICEFYKDTYLTVGNWFGRFLQLNIYKLNSNCSNLFLWSLSMKLHFVFLNSSEEYEISFLLSTQLKIIS